MPIATDNIYYQINHSIHQWLKYNGKLNYQNVLYNNAHNFILTDRFRELCIFFFFSERDNFEKDQMDATRQLTILEGAHSNVLKERDDLVKEV